MANHSFRTKYDITRLYNLLLLDYLSSLRLMTLRSNYRSVQNQVWAGMAKETAHQLGTPVSSLEGWVEVMKEKPENSAIVTGTCKRC